MTTKHINFDTPSHTYTRNGSKYTSVTTHIHNFYEQFDAEGMSVYKSIQKFYGENTTSKLKTKYGDWSNIVKQFKQNASDNDKEIVEALAANLRQEWDSGCKEACDKGTAYHLDKENDVIANGVQWKGEHIPHRKWEFGDALYLDDKFVVTELIMFNDDALLAGSADLIIYDRGEWWVYDYKTNKEIQMTAFRDKKMLGKFSELPDTNYGHYTAQLNMYRQLLLRQYPETECNHLEILHYDVPYVLPVIQKDLL